MKKLWIVVLLSNAIFWSSFSAYTWFYPLTEIDGVPGILTCNNTSCVGHIFQIREHKWLFGVKDCNEYYLTFYSSYNASSGLFGPLRINETLVGRC